MNNVRLARQRLIRAMSAATVGLAAVMTTGLVSTPAQAACSAGDVGKSITSIKASDAEGELSVTNTVTAWQDVNVEITGLLPAGGCTGDYLEVTLPAALGEDTANFPILTPDGKVMGQMTVTGRQVRMVFNSYVEDNDNVQFRGWLTVQLGSSIKPSTTAVWTFGVKGRDRQQTVRTAECTACSASVADPRKWAVVGSDRKSVWFGIESATTAAAGEQIVVTDTVDDAQALRCSEISVLAANTRDAWGVPIFNVAVPAATVVCAAKTLTVTISASAPGLIYQVAGTASITAPRASYSDNATVTQGAQSSALSATAYVKGGGANGVGNKKATPTTPTTPQTPAASGQTPTTTGQTPGTQTPGTQTPTTAQGKGAGQASTGAKGKKAKSKSGKKAQSKKAKGKKAHGKKATKAQGSKTAGLAGKPPKGHTMPAAGNRIS